MSGMSQSVIADQLVQLDFLRCRMRFRVCGVSRGTKIILLTIITINRIDERKEINQQKGTEYSVDREKWSERPDQELN